MSGYLWHFLLLALAVAASWYLVTLRTDRVVTKDPIQLRGADTFDFEIAGESHAQDALQYIAGGRNEDGVEHYCVATLVPDPFNRYDPQAISVKIDGRHVGFIPKPMTAPLHRLMVGRTAEADAVIVGGWHRGRGDSGHFGVKLDLAWPPRIAEP
jgi:hypothetical protein